MKIILAVDQNWGIGRDNKMLFHIKKDLKHFKETTSGNVVIMGRNTYESMGKALVNRENIVLTRNPNLKLKDAMVFNNKESVLSYVKASRKEAFVIGGAQIVDIFLPYCNEAIITKIEACRDSDIYLHNFDQDPDFIKVGQSITHTENGIKFSYVNYRRI